MQNFRRANWNHQKEVSQYIEDVQEKMRSDLIIQEGRIFNNSNSCYISIEKSIKILQKMHEIFSKKVEVNSMCITPITVSDIYSNNGLCERGNNGTDKGNNNIDRYMNSGSKKDRITISQHTDDFAQDKNGLKVDLVSRIIQINF